MRFTHVLNPFTAKPGTEHDRAQRVTFASMRRAVAEAHTAGVGVEVLAPVFPADLAAVEAPAKPLPVLHRDVQDVRKIQPPRHFPFIRDLLRTATRDGTGDYAIYTNIDIALQPHFYTALDAMIRKLPPDQQMTFAGTINRRTIGDEFTGPEQLEAMYKAPSAAHPGADCFVFPRAWIPRLHLAHLCIGTRYFDSVLILNLDALCGFKFQWLRDEHLTFHIGDDRSWVSRVDYDEFNLREAHRALRHIRREHRLPGTSYADYVVGMLDADASWKRWGIRQLKRIRPLVKAQRFVRDRMGLGRAKAVMTPAGASG
jgi:hypothetical protein